MDDCCANCRFVRVSGSDANCLRNPPQVHFLVQPTLNGPSLTLQSAWPPVRMEQWCGEHRRGPGRVVAAPDARIEAAPARSAD